MGFFSFSCPMGLVFVAPEFAKLIVLRDLANLVLMAREWWAVCVTMGSLCLRRHPSTDTCTTLPLLHVFVIELQPD